jgi:5-(carboxyamino)imidazole ribonucleotide synthase
MRVGVLGGGQLGRMLALAGCPLGFRFRFLDPDPAAPAGQVGELITGEYDDERALERLASGLDLVTYEFESVPRAAADFVASRVQVWPPVAALAAAQDRLAERELFERVQVPVAPYSGVSSAADVAVAASRVGFPALLKTRTHGYDGKGQVAVSSAEETIAAWRSTGERPCILERRIEFRRELSVISVRARDGSVAVYPLVENLHSEGILRASFAPAITERGVEDEASGFARRVGEELGYVGVFAIELFETDVGLIANEMAPRVHNSGHWTIEGAVASQFENHLRAIAGFPLGSTEARGFSGMVNLIGTVPPLERLLDLEGAHVHLYGKSPRPRRKLGHVTVCEATPDAVRERIAGARNVLAAR